MRTILFLLLTTILTQAQQFKVESILIDGVTYSNVTLKKNVDGVSVYHKDGIKRIDYTKLQKNVLDIVGPFDSKKAEAAKKQTAANTAISEKQVVVIQKPEVKPTPKPTIQPPVEKQSPFKKTNIQGSSKIEGTSLR